MAEIHSPQNMSDVDYVVEATHEEMTLLYRLYRFYPWSKDVPWDHGMTSTKRDIGKVITIPSRRKVLAQEEWPIVVGIAFEKINGHWVAFHEAVSPVVDHNKVKEYIAKAFPNVPRCDVANFQHCFLFCTQAKKDK